MLITNRRSWREELLGVWRRRDLLALLAQRDITLRYRQTALGVVWVVLQPLLVSGLFTFVFGSVAHLPTEGVPYFLFAFSGMVGWNLFANGMSRSGGALLANSALVSKIYFPRLILPLAAIVVCLLDGVIATVAMIVFMLVGGVSLSVTILTLPLWLAAVTLLAAGAGLVTGALMVRYRDVQYVLPLFLQLLLFASPVAYAFSAVPERFQGVLRLNPLVTLIDGVRWSFLRTEAPDLAGMAISLALVVLVPIVGLAVFRRAETDFADVI